MGKICPTKKFRNLQNQPNGKKEIQTLCSGGIRGFNAMGYFGQKERGTG